MGEVAGPAEDDDGRRPDRQPLEPLGERVLLLDLFDGGHRYSACACVCASGSAALTAWPPNWLRRAALTLAA